jgi:hypothetical protein
MPKRKDAHVHALMSADAAENYGKLATELCLRLVGGGGKRQGGTMHWEYAFLIERPGRDNPELILGWRCFKKIGFGPKAAHRLRPDERLPAFQIVANIHGHPLTKRAAWVEIPFYYSFVGEVSD